MADPSSSKRVLKKGKVDSITIRIFFINVVINIAILYIYKKYFLNVYSLMLQFYALVGLPNLQFSFGCLYQGDRISMCYTDYCANQQVGWPPVQFS